MCFASWTGRFGPNLALLYISPPLVGKINLLKIGNIVKRKQDSKSSVHLFLDCFYVKFLWRVVHLLFGILPPPNIFDLFNRW